ncbi:MAG: hypothetical protein KTR19_04540 [Hyphomicrobiales bacterium]|nr:hypothetical protein [Hyphomicrobiales bacterium]
MSLPVICLSLGVNLFSLVPPLAVYVLLDLASEGRENGVLIALFCGSALAVLAEAVLRIARNRLFHDMAAKEIYDLQMSMARQLLNTSWSAAMRLPPAAAASAMQAVEELSQLYSADARLGILELPFIVLCLAAIGTIGGSVVVAPIILMLLFCLWTLRAQKAIQTAEQEVKNLRHERAGLCAQGIERAATVKSLAIEPHLKRRLESLFRSAAPSGEAYLVQLNHIMMAGQLYEKTVFILVLAGGGMLAAGGSMSIAALAASALLALLFARASRRLCECWTHADAAQRAFERSKSLSGLPKKSFFWTGIAGPAKVQFNGVGMAFDGRSQDSRGVNLTIRPGETIGIVTRDDAQRDQLSRIFSCSLVPDYGEILVDGRIASPDTDEGLRGVMLLNDRPSIFHGTVIENISMFGCISPVSAIELAQRLDVEGLIQNLPDGYSTQLDPDRSAYFSKELFLGIALVRAVALRPRLLVLDMSCAGADGEGVGAYMKLIEELNGATTIIALTKRPAGSVSEGCHYEMTDWSLEPVEPGLGDENAYDDWGMAGDD